MRRSPIASRLLDDETPDCGTHARVVGQMEVKPAARGVAKVVQVELLGMVKSAWKW